MTSSRSLELSRRVRILALAAAAACWLVGPGVRTARAQSPNSGSLTFTGGVDVASVHVFRGLVQEQEPNLTLFPYGDLAIALTSGEGLVRSTVVNVGVWNSLNTGSSGTDGPSGHVHYEEQFDTRLNLLFAGGIGIGAGYMARTSPNNMFDTEKEIQLKVAKASRLSPYAFLAVELNAEGQADGARNKGTYLEIGAIPSFPVGGRARLAVPAKVGFSAKDYYELAGTDHKFGFFDVGVLLTLPLARAPTRVGSWNIHGGGEFYAFGDTAKAANRGDASKIVGFVGIGVLY